MAPNIQLFGKSQINLVILSLNRNFAVKLFEAQIYALLIYEDETKDKAVA